MNTDHATAGTATAQPPSSPPTNTEHRRHRHQYWMLWQDMQPPYSLLHEFSGVMDDYGNLVEAAEWPHEIGCLGEDLHDGLDPDETWALYLDTQYPLRHEHARQAAATLARPAPITAAIEPHPFHSARIVVGADARLDVPCYLIDVPHCEPLLVTAAQLAAIATAAAELLAPADRGLLS